MRALRPQKADEGLFLCRVRGAILLSAALLFLYCHHGLAGSSSDGARTLLEEAVELLSRMGGIASLETLPGKPLPTGEIKNPIAPEDVAGTLEKVISDLHRVIEIDPSIKEAYYFLGVAYLKKADRDEAISAFYRALDAEPDRETTYILLCYLLWDASEYKEALDVTSGYAARFPDSEATAAILTGKTYFYLKDYQKALGYGLRLIQLDRSRWEGPALAAASYYCLGDRQSAAEQFKALEANPKSSGDIAQLKKDLKEKCGE